jgi:hypothetical protein
MGTFLQVSALASHSNRLDDCANCTPTAVENDKKQRQLLFAQDKQQANPLLSMHNYTPLEIRTNDKNKQQILISQRKLALTAIHTRFEL